MIAKIKTGKFFKGALKYNLDKVKEGKASFFYSAMFKKEDPSFQEMREEFLEMAKMCPNVSNPVFHTSLNFSPNEYLDDETLQAVIDEYMQGMGYDNTPYIVFKHGDTSHQHVHVVSINIENKDGKLRKINDSFQYYKSERISRKIEKEYGLVVATEVVKKRQELQKLIPELKAYGEVETYEQLRNVASHIVVNYHFTNLLQLNALLNRYKITCFKNKPTNGKEYYKFTFLNPATRKNVGVGGTALQLGLGFDLEKILEENKAKKVDLSDLTGYKKELLEKFLFITQEDLDRYLKKRDLIKIGEGMYLNSKVHTILPITKLRLPSAFVNKVTLKKEYFQNIVKSATEYRKTLSIFHESTMFEKPEYISGFRNYFSKQETHLTDGQKTLLLDSFLQYKQNNIDKIRQAEHEKDIKLVNKMLSYVASLNISDATARLFLEKFNIELAKDNVLVGNQRDSIIHAVSYKELSDYHFGSHDCRAEFQRLNSQEIELIRCAINEKPPVLSENIIWENVAPFIPENYASEYQLEERLDTNFQEFSNTIEPSNSHSYGMLNSINEYSYPGKKKKKKDEDSDDETSSRKRKRRKI